MIEELAKLLCASLFPDIERDYAWDVQDEDGRNEFRNSAKIAIQHLHIECECTCTTEEEATP